MCIALKRHGLGNVNIPSSIIIFLFKRLEHNGRSVGFSEHGSKEIGPGPRHNHYCGSFISDSSYP